MEYTKITLKKNEEHRIKSGHLWVFSNEIEKLDKKIPAGSIVDVYSSKNEFLGKGFFNPNTLISVRLLTSKNEEIDFNFFRNKILTAKQLRDKIYPYKKAFRLVHSESDYLPGLIIDKYNDSYSIQLNCAGLKNYFEMISEILKSDLHAKNIILRNDTPSRKLEGLEKIKRQIFGDSCEEIIDDGMFRLKVNLLEGQKTGIYLDQSENRHSIIPLCKNSEVLDCFCNDGGFSLAALSGGAMKVISVDISEESLNRYRENLSINQFDSSRTEIVNDDVFKFLKSAVEQNHKFDLVVLDPPSFTKSKKNIPQAKKGYFTINYSAFRLIKDGGFIATSSCSHHISENDFLEIILNSALKSKRKFSILKTAGASADHPVHPMMPETKYLKFVLIKITD